MNAINFLSALVDSNIGFRIKTYNQLGKCALFNMVTHNLGDLPFKKEFELAEELIIIKTVKQEAVSFINKQDKFRIL